MKQHPSPCRKRPSYPGRFRSRTMLFMVYSFSSSGVPFHVEASFTPQQDKPFYAPPSPPTPPPLTDETIRQAVQEWLTADTVQERQDVLNTYGPIAEWDTSHVTNAKELFAHARYFNEDLSLWNTSSMTDMSYMFAFGSAFVGSGSGGNSNSDLSKWDTSKVTSMAFMFHHASVFEGRGLVHWDVGKVRDLTYFAQGAVQFREHVWRWNTRAVLSYNRAFHNATLFSSQLCWHLHPRASAVQTFCGTNGAKFDLACASDNGNDDASTTTTSSSSDNAVAVVLESPLNKNYHDCCDCEYSAEQHAYVSQFMQDHDNNKNNIYWIDDEDYNQNAQEKDRTIGIILIGCIWGLVLGLICALIVVTIRRRHEVHDWIKTLTNKVSSGSSRANSATSEEDPAAIATFVGPATDSATAPTLAAVIDTDRVIAAPVVVVGAGHVQHERADATRPPPNTATAEASPMAAAQVVNSSTNDENPQLPHAAVLRDEVYTLHPTVDDDYFC